MTSTRGAVATEGHLDACGKERFHIEPLFGSGLPSIASFMQGWRNENSRVIERRLKWLLLENPIACEHAPVGFSVRDAHGIIRGITLCFPSAFLAGDRRLLGLCSGSFFVEEPARSTGFYLFKKYLASRGYSFYYATTCNTNSEPLWRMLGGRMVPNSEVEYIVPLRVDVVLAAALSSRSEKRLAPAMLRRAGRCANPLARFLARRSSSLSTERCQDWEKLAELAHRHRAEGSVVSERSAEFLRWRYGSGSPAHPCAIYLCRDQQGNEGWFALGNLTHGNVRGPILLDVVWPHTKESFADLFRSMLRLAGGSDAFFFRRQPGIDSREVCRWAIPHKLDARTFVISREPLELQNFDYTDNDYLAWMFDWKDRGV
jgi:hypothetical protein